MSVAVSPASLLAQAPLLSEDLLQFIWQYRLFNTDALYTTEGEPVRILSVGSLNRHAGPDFSSARIRIGQTLWAGNVEIHLKTSDWFKHRHQQDARYDRVILHVVFEQDMHPAALNMPCVVLQPRVSKLLLWRYQQMSENTAFVPCGVQAGKVTRITWKSWSDRLLLERWERKTSDMQGWLMQTTQNWEETCYQGLVQGFGQPTNADAFLQLAKSIPLRILMRNKTSLDVIEALLFGQAGMLEASFTDEYPQNLQRIYKYLRHKYQLQPIATHAWKWLRMRPAAFPTLRIAMLAALIHERSHLFSHILSAKKLAMLEGLLIVQPSAYWHTHYRFDLPVTRTLIPGKQLANNLMINTVLPLLYWYGQQKGEPDIQERAIDWINELKPEANNIIQGWNDLGVVAESALDTQALLQLKQCYCDERRCLECAIGAKILKGSSGE